jgi:CheY-like chemotaxis protein
MAAASDKIGTMNRSFQPFTFLAVDDSAISCKLVEHSLLGQEYEVRFAKNGRDALDLFAKHQLLWLLRIGACRKSADWNYADVYVRTS